MTRNTQVHGIFQARLKNWVGSNSDFGRKSVQYPYGTSGIHTILSNSDTGFFLRPVSEIGEKKSFFRIRDVRYGYRTSSTGTGLFSGSGSNIYTPQGELKSLQSLNQSTRTVSGKIFPRSLHIVSRSNDSANLWTGPIWLFIFNALPRRSIYFDYIWPSRPIREDQPHGA